jgi:hypothetical protein
VLRAEAEQLQPQAEWPDAGVPQPAAQAEPPPLESRLEPKQLQASLPQAQPLRGVPPAQALELSLPELQVLRERVLPEVLKQASVLLPVAQAQPLV